jgi:ribosomal-protein-serine acetyltransferase
MHYRIIEEDIKVCLSVPEFAEELFELTDKNRVYLRQWLPWLDAIQKTSDTKEFIDAQLESFSKKEAVHQTIFYKDKIAGVLGFNEIDQAHRIGYIGYWLGQEFTGLGIMTKSVSDLIHQGFIDWELQRLEIRCAVDNVKSRAIPERLGFRNEGIIRRAEKVNSNYYDHVVYGLRNEEKVSLSDSENVRLEPCSMPAGKGIK